MKRNRSGYWRLNTIKRRMIFGVLILILLLQISAATIQVVQARLILTQGLQSEAKNVTTPLFINIEKKLDLIDVQYDYLLYFQTFIHLAGLYQFGSLIKEQEKLEEIQFVAPNGTILAHQSQPMIGQSVANHLKAMIGPGTLSKEVNRQIHVFIPYRYQGTFYGGMLLSYSNRQMQQARNRIMWISFVLLILYLVIGSIATFLLSRTITRPINQLNREFNTIASGNLDLEIDTSRTDELGGLAKSFAEMKASIIEKINLKNQAQAETIRMKEQTVLELQRLDKLKDEFLAKTSHELKTPLHGIMGISELLFEKGINTTEKELKAELGTIYACGKRLSTIIDDILDYSKLKNGILTLNQATLPLKQVAQLIIDLLYFFAKDKNISIINEINPNHFILADENRCQQIMQNLLDNAIKFTPSGWVSLRSQLVGEFVEVEITDTGIGIAGDHLDIIFKSFEQLEKGSSETRQGVGLGLSITRHLVELHGGSIRVESVPGKGSSFYFTLPQSTADPATSQFNQRLLNLPDYQQAKVDNDGDRSILVVEDDPTVRHVIRSILNDHYRVTDAVNGLEAWEQLQQGTHPDLILLDLMLPVMDGFELCRKIRAKKRFDQIAIVILTAKSMLDDFAIALQIGANDFLKKPINKDTLLTRVNLNIPENRNKLTSPGCWTIFCHLEKIVYIKIEKNSSRIFLENTEQTILVQTPLSTIKEEFGDQLFSPHQHYLINADKQARIRRRSVSDYELVFNDGKTVPISRKLYPTVKQRYNAAGEVLSSNLAR